MPIRYNSVSLTNSNDTYPYNIAKGNNALANVSVDASYNIAFGYNAGSNLINGNNNTFIGSNTNINSSSNTFSNSTAIGTGATIDASNQIILGVALQNVVVPGTLIGFGVILPSFKILINSNSITSISPYNYVPIPYNVVEYDYNLGGISASNYNISTYKYIVPLSGKYIFTYNYNITNTNIYSYCSFIAINNTTTYPSDPSGQLYLCDNNFDTTGTDYSQGSLSIRLNQNDIVNIFGYFKNFTSIYFNNSLTYNNILNSGGNITYTDSNGLNPRSSPPYPYGYAVHTFEYVGTETFVCNTNITISYLIVAGGGSGGRNVTGGITNNLGGGGGAGGYLSGSININAGTYSVIVGDGGIPQNIGVGDGVGSNGGDSNFGQIIAYGGGAGGTLSTPIGKHGGSGGGGGYATTYDSGGSGTSGQGNKGSKGINTKSGGGGGGAGGAGGGGGTIADNGTPGPAVSNSISGVSEQYSYGGGGGGTGQSYTIYGAGGMGISDTFANYGPDGRGIQGIVIIRYPYSNVYGVSELENNWFTGEMVSY